MLLKQARGARKPIIGMVQLGPLAGSSRHRGDSIGKALDAALEDAALLARHGIDAVMLQNLGDLPVALRVAAPQIAWMTRMASEVARETRLPVGLNFLENDAEAMFAVASAAPVDFVRIKVFVDAMVTPAGLEGGQAFAAQRARTLWGAGRCAAAPRRSAPCRRNGRPRTWCVGARTPGCVTRPPRSSAPTSWPGRTPKPTCCARISIRRSCRPFRAASIPLDLLDAYRLAFVPVGFSHDRLAAPLEQAQAWSKVTPAGDVVADPAQGSNNWTIAGSRTATRRPVLANDPHRAHAAPSLRYLVHLTAPGLDAIGTGEATFPGIMIGHNGEIAFGLTLFMGHDEEDFYVYETRPGQPNDYRYGDGWEPMRMVEKRVPVRGAADQTLTLKFTRHGPVVMEEPDKRRAYAVRTVLADPGIAAYGASLIAMRCRDFAGFRAAMRHWGAPAVNQVYADRGGTIGWVVAGFNPVRDTWDGLLPVPGDGSHEWRGFTDPDHLPWSQNPAAGFVATANEMNVPPDWHHLARPIGYEWWETSRARRLHEVLAGQTSHAVADSQRLQTDVVSVPARRLHPLLAALADADEDTWRALMLLRGWDCQVTADSGPAALFEVWWSRHLKPGLIALLVPDAAARALLVPLDTESVVRALERPGPRFGPDPASSRDRLLAGSLAAAYRDVRARLGEDVAGWRWGLLHHG